MESQYRTLPAISLCAVDKGYFVDGSMQLAAMSDGQLVGCIDLYNYDPVHLRAEVGIVVDKGFRRQGYAHAMLHELDTLCRDVLSLHQLYCDIVVTHAVSLHLFERNGYKRVGCMCEWVLIDENYFDVVRLQKILSPDLHHTPTGR